MGTCLKCGYEGHREAFAVCDKCGAIQEKVRIFIAEKIKAGSTTCDELASLCSGEVKRANDLSAFVTKNSSMIVDWQKNCLDPLAEVEGTLEKITAQIDQLKNHVSVVTVNFEANSKLAKLGEYFKKFREEIERNASRLDDLWTYARNAALNHAIGVPKDFEPPTGNPDKYEILEEVETRIQESRYPSMLIIAGLYKGIGWLAAILMVIIALAGFLSGEKAGIPVAIGALIVGPIVSISLFAFAESIKIGVDIEQNTRATREYVRRLFMNEISGK